MEQKNLPVFHHVHVFCHDLQRMIDFWRRTFGLTYVGKRMFGPCDGADLLFSNGSHLYLKQVDPESPEGKIIREPSGKCRGGRQAASFVSGGGARLAAKAPDLI